MHSYGPVGGVWDALGTHPDHFLIFLVRSNHCEAELGDVKEIASEVAMDVRAVDEEEESSDEEDDE